MLCSSDGLCYEISLDTFFNARHYVTIRGHMGTEHPHSYRLHVRYRTRTLAPEDHVVVGYQTLRERTELAVRAYNGQLLNDLPVFQRLQPTTENLTAILYQQLQRLLADLSVDIVSVTLWESPTAAITYGEA
ncbi:MAG: 6-carboxytetrahydropterin synthase [Chloroflexi bacterium]|nr:6-carboxytetrahydropterin synthase [Chloroflexota bacterium]MBU1746803.1 6-carboxytetrahydropterin synthase [Chloroflexota bacterium]